jgi:hypothetical protein
MAQLLSEQPSNRAGARWRRACNSRWPKELHVSKHAFVLIITAVVALSTATSRAENWKSIRLQSAQGNKIRVDYTVKQKVRYGRSGNVKNAFFVADKVHVNVLGPNVQPGSKVKVVLSNHLYPGKPVTYRVGLRGSQSAADGFHFTGTLAQGDTSFNGHPLSADSAIRTAEDNGQVHRQDIAVEIDGVRQTDPVNGTSLFKFALGAP